MSRAWAKPFAGGIELLLRVQPRASKTRVVGEHGEHLKIALRAPPVEGAANDELAEFLARHFGVPRRQVEMLSGEHGRIKRVRVSGGTEETAEGLLADVVR